MSSWLIIERLENWEADKTSGFSIFGISERYAKQASKISEGDLIFCYVSSGISAFSDIRTVRGGGLRPLRRQDTRYDSAFDFYIATAPLLILERTRWLPLSEIREFLDLTKDRKVWVSVFRTSLRSLTNHDSEFLKRRIEQLAS